jgi:hypothetical protein
MKDEFLEFYRTVNLAHRELVAKCVAFEHQLPSLSGDLHDLADLAYVLRECYAHADESRKELSRVQALLAKLYYILWASDPSAVDSVKTRWCSCTPDPKTVASIPHHAKEPQAYAAIMRVLGVPEAIIPTGLMRVGWEEFGNFLTERTKQGLPIPDGIDPSKTHIEYRLSIRRRQQLPTGASGDPAAALDNPVKGEEDYGEGQGQDYDERESREHNAGEGADGDDCDGTGDF